MSTTHILTTFLLLLVALLSGCSRATPNAGHEIVLVAKPMFFGHGGVDPEPVTSGSTLIAATTDEIVVNMLPIQVNEHFEDLMSSDGVPLDFDAAIRMRVLKSVPLIRDFGSDWYKNNIQAEFRERVRQAVRNHGMNETAISSIAIAQIDDEVTSKLRDYLQKDLKITVELLGVTIGKANPPDAIKNQRVETAAQQQRILSEQQRKLAEDQRRAAELARAEADNAYRSAMGLSPEQYLALERIKMQALACSRGGCTFINGQTPALVLK